ncbi:MAG: murein biosynthesis integral membrane protein MurJ [bacterium]|nr:murein biosynthesis integral membrane protein MurJ [bacterium]
MSSAARNSLKLSVFTIGSRLLGVIRDHYQAFFLGTGAVSAAWEIAYLLPNMLRNLLADGILAQSFIPVYSEALDRSEAEARRVSGLILTFLAIALSTLVCLGVLSFPYVLPVLFDQTPEEADLLVDISRVMFVFILTASLTAILAGMANSHQHFSFPALSPILLNVVFLFGFLFVLDVELFTPAENVRRLAIVVVVGGFAQLLLQSVYIVRNGWRPRLHLDLKDPALGKIFSLMAPAVLGAGLFQLNQLSDVAIASFFIPDDQDAIPALRYSQRLIQLPTGVIGVALSTAILPALSRGLRDRTPEKSAEHARELEGALSFALFLTVPAALGLYFLDSEIINFIYFGGLWDAESTRLTALALVFYSLGVPFFSINRILTSAYFAHQDTRTPVRFLGLIAVVNFSMNMMLVHSFYQSGIAISSVCSSALYTILLGWFFHKNYLRFSGRRLLAFFQKSMPVWVIFAAYLLALNWYGQDMLYALADSMSENVGGLHPVRYRALAMLLVGVGGGGALYFALAHLFRMEELRVITRFVRRDRG